MHRLEICVIEAGILRKERGCLQLVGRGKPGMGERETISMYCRTSSFFVTRAYRACDGLYAISSRRCCG